MSARARLPNRRTAGPRPVFALKIEGQPGAGGIKALRALLKILLRGFGFRAIDVRQIEARTQSHENK